MSSTATPTRIELNYDAALLEDKWRELHVVMEEEITNYRGLYRNRALSIVERNNAGFAAKGMEAAMESWEAADTLHRATLEGWTMLVRLLDTDINSGYYRPESKIGLQRALSHLQRLRAATV